MSNSTGISELYREFTDALTEVLAENATGPAHCGSSRGSPLSRKHPDYGEFGYLAAVETACRAAYGSGPRCWKRTTGSFSMRTDKGGRQVSLMWN